MMKGHAIVVGDDINTDLIIASKHKRDTYDPKIMCVHLFEDLDPALFGMIRQGDVLIAGKNFGCGSSREHAAHVIKAAGIQAVIAKSYARIFFRNAINIGLPLLESDTDGIQMGDEITIDLDAGKAADVTTGKQMTFGKLSPAVQGIFDAGGLLEYLQKYGDFQ